MWEIDSFLLVQPLKGEVMSRGDGSQPSETLNFKIFKLPVSTFRSQFLHQYDECIFSLSSHTDSLASSSQSGGVE